MDAMAKCDLSRYFASRAKLAPRLARLKKATMAFFNKLLSG